MVHNIHYSLPLYIKPYTKRKRITYNIEKIPLLSCFIIIRFESSISISSSISIKKKR